LWWARDHRAHHRWSDTPKDPYGVDKGLFWAHMGWLLVKQDEENFDEAEAQAYRCWSETKIPSDISALFNLPAPPPTTPAHTAHFHKLLSALQEYTLTVPPYTLPLSATLPDMRASTEAYVKLQKMYKARAEEEGAVFRKIMSKSDGRETGGDKESVDTFLKNCHALKVLKGKKWSAFDEDRGALATALQTFPKETATHLALSSLSSLPASTSVTVESLRSAVQNIVGQDMNLPEEFDNAAGEISRSPTSDLPTTAAFLGGLVAQEAIKMITKQYVPVNGYCVVDLVDTWTGVIA